MSSLEASLLSWYRRHRRKLPWRDEPTPYKVWVSESMLQQTQVRTMLPYFERFVDRFPDVDSLAASSEQEVLALWSGLGYYRRAKALHRAARWIVTENHGRFPSTFEGWRALPGVGRYTAGAILSIAFDERYPILDGNVTRVLSRIFKIRGNPRSREVRRALWRKAEEILPSRRVSAFNQALMELGALVCTPRAPRCPRCPVMTLCRARMEGLESVLPEIPARGPTLGVRLAAAVIRRGRSVLMYRRQAESLMQDLWELPGGACRGRERPQTALVREARDRYGIELEPLRPLALIKHSIMNRRITLHTYEARIRGRLKSRSARAWVEPEEVVELPVSSMTLKVFRMLKQNPTT